MNKELLFFYPEYKETLWGGNKMKTIYGYDIPSETTGECWAISAHEKGDCVCATGEFAGRKLSVLWKNHRELFGNLHYDKFPLLLKVIDAKENLSIQVHPSDEFAQANEEGSYGKTECWYVLDCDEGSKLIVGHNARTREELCKAIDDGKIEEIVREIDVKPGDCVHIDPGTIHSIKGGVMLLEIQQNSDLTYRVYDYNRLYNGKARELHIEKAKEAIEVPDSDDTSKVTSEDAGVERLISCKYFDVNKINVYGGFSLNDHAPFVLVSCVNGEGYADGVKIKAGDHFLVPFEYGKVCFSGHMTLITSIPK